MAGITIEVSVKAAPSTTTAAILIGTDTPRIHQEPPVTSREHKSELGDVELQVAPSSATRPANTTDFHDLVPRPCDDAMRFNCMTFWFCLICAITPFAILLPLALKENNTETYISYWIAIAVLAGVGTLYLCFSLRRTLWGGVCCKPAAPAQTGPLAKGHETHQQVKPRKLYVLVNPYGGLRQGLNILEKVVLPMWSAAGIETVVLKTEYAGHARDYAATIPLDGFDGLCVIGGDGSFHEMVNGLLSRKDQKQIPLGLIPGGSGNSVGFDLGLFDAKEAAARIASGSTVAVDANRVTDSAKLLVYSVNELSWGLVGDVGVVAESCRCCGPARYDLCSIWTVLKGTTSRMEMFTDGDTSKKIRGEFVTAFVNQTQHFGKGLRATPAAKIDDGLMDLCFMKEGTRGEQLEIFLQLPTGSHQRHPGLNFQQVRELSMTPAAKCGVLNIDGEIMRYDGTVRVQCVPRAFRMFIPPDCRGPSLDRK